MATAVILPRFNFEMEEGTVGRWLREPGERVAAGEPICEVETDKVAMEVEAPASGILAGIRASAGDTLPVAGLLAYIADNEEEAAKLDAEARERPAPAAAAPTAAEAADPPPPATEPREPAGDPGRLRMAPAVRRLAAEHGLDLVQLAGSSGQVSMQDVRAAIDAGVGRPERLVETPLSSTRRTIAERMMRAHVAPHINLTAEVRFGRVAALRAAWAGQRPGLVALVAAAAIRALRLHPLLNSTFAEDRLTTHSEVNLGIAVARPEGLIVPVLREADQLSVSEISASLRDLVDRARDGRLKPEETRGGTFTISSLGERGVDHFTALINPPQVGILAVGRVADRFVAGSEGQPVLEPTAQLTLSCDHRVVDGAPGADFLQSVRAAIEDPSWMEAS